MSDNSLYFRSDNGDFTKTVNVLSPSLTGTPTVPTPKKSDSMSITNVEFVKAYIDNKIKNFKFHTVTVLNNEITLYPNKEYFINVSGLIDMKKDSGNVTIGSIALTDNSGNVIGRIGGVSSSYSCTGGIIQSGTIVVRTPMNGIVKGFVNYGGSKGQVAANYMCAIEVDRDDYCNITIKESPNQTMILTVNDDEYSPGDYMISKNSVYKIKAIPDINYKNGTISPGTEGIIEGDTIFTISEAVFDPCVVTINQSPNQTITVTNEETDHTESFIGRYGSTYTANVVSNRGYIAGTLNTVEGTIDNSITVQATPAIAIYRRIMIEQQPHQVITLTRLDSGDTTTTLFSVPDGTRILAEIKADADYIHGTLNVDAYFEANSDMIVTSTKPIHK